MTTELEPVTGPVLVPRGDMPLWEYTARQWLEWGVGAWVIGPLLAKLDDTPDRCPHCKAHIR
jgi:hypothetical protein